MRSIALFIGRVSPPHLEHFNTVLRRAYENSDHLLVLLGSANRARSPKNPFHPSERTEMLRMIFEANGYPAASPRVAFREVDDSIYCNGRWVEEVGKIVGAFDHSVRELFGEETSITLYGCDKDATTYYLHQFPAWKLSKQELQRQLDATEIRRRMFHDEGWQELVDPVLERPLTAWLASDLGQWCREEALYYVDYKRPYAKAKEIVGHEIISITADTIALWRGQVALVKRKFNPGKGLWALPGGYMHHDELPQTTALRETREETGLRLREEWIRAQYTYAAPDRDLRGRVVTLGYGFAIPENVDPSVYNHLLGIRGADDAAEAVWVPLADVLTKPEYRRGLLGDHHDIITHMTGLLRSNV